MVFFCLCMARFYFCLQHNYAKNEQQFSCVRFPLFIGTNVDWCCCLPPPQSYSILLFRVLPDHKFGIQRVKLVLDDWKDWRIWLEICNVRERYNDFHSFKSFKRLHTLVAQVFYSMLYHAVKRICIPVSCIVYIWNKITLAKTTVSHEKQTATESSTLVLWNKLAKEMATGNGRPATEQKKIIICYFSPKVLMYWLLFPFPFSVKRRLNLFDNAA